jgi:hypothetical protein
LATSLGFAARMTACGMIESNRVLNTTRAWL